METAHSEYARRLAARQSGTARWNRRTDRLSNLRLTTFVAGAALCFPVFGAAGWPVALLLLPAGTFAFLVVLHERWLQSRDRSLRAEAFHEQGIRRVTDEWPGTGDRGDRYLDPDHPYAGDLDVFGRGSLFERLCTARTRAGQDALAARLAAPSGIGEVRERQAAVDELRGRLDLREEVALLGEDVPVGIDAATLEDWGSAPPVLRGPLVPAAALALGTIGLTVLVLWFSRVVGPLPLLGAIAANLLLAAPFRRRVARVIAFADRPTNELDLLSRILARFEAERFESPLLVRLRSELEADGAPPSVRIRKLVRRIQLVDAGRNQLFMPIAMLVLWQTQLAFAVERWRARDGRHVGRWLEAVGEIEALLALATWAYECDGDPFPELSEEGPVFEAKAIGHPLLPDDRCVRNDLSLGGGLHLLVVSGSNMSGKSTMLRTAGVNGVLAFAGAPVRAEALRLSPLRIAASMRVQDSLLEGDSRFYAELKRLKQVVDLAETDPPVLFLLDELLSGTNSHDRAAGAEGLVRGLVERGAIGLVTTHDLALGRIADALAPRAANVHFEDQLEGGEMSFDYRLRPGVVQKSNALELMRAIGLEV